MLASRQTARGIARAVQFSRRFCASSGGSSDGSGTAKPVAESVGRPAEDAHTTEGGSSGSNEGGGKKRLNVPISNQRLTELFRSEMLHLDKNYKQPSQIEAMSNMVRMEEMDGFQRAGWLAEQVRWGLWGVLLVGRFWWFAIRRSNTISI